MMASFYVRTDSHFERLSHTLRKHHPDFDDYLAKAVGILQTDPYNQTRIHPIKKLIGVPRGEGAFRIRLRRWRFRYDIYGQEVVLTNCGLRREGTYD